MRNMSFIGVHLRQRNGLRVTSEDLLSRFSSLHADRLVPFGVALTWCPLATFATISASATASTITVTASAASATIVVSLSSATSIIVSVGRVDIQTDVPFAKIVLNEATKQQLESLDVPSFSSD